MGRISLGPNRGPESAKLRQVGELCEKEGLDVEKGKAQFASALPVALKFYETHHSDIGSWIEVAEMCRVKPGGVFKGDRRELVELILSAVGQLDESVENERDIKELVRIEDPGRERHQRLRLLGDQLKVRS